jgi:hypothetical protein
MKSKPQWRLMSTLSLFSLSTPGTQNTNLTRLDRVVIEDYYHMLTMDENVIWMRLTQTWASFL